MGLFDQLITMVAGDKMSQFQSVIEWIDKQGGLAGVADKFNQQGLGEIVQSWIGNGENLPVSVNQLIQVFGNLDIQQLAQQVGFDSQETTELIAKYLPKLVNQATPEGVLPEHIDLSAIGMNMLKEKLFG
ncbi:YidB family protein [Providencia vermicola]|uniref:DUF937 domain-containing protein n=1 Tax=Providencia stuartii TaxID=588 RepID=A0AAI9MVP6_PROST|nr:MULTISPECIES: YidB family protein [Providencia]ELR5043427.1 DUF937 domain-containing protein [Providencia rettgeri]ELR5035004.1 DUF937 domain-containing protein [Providencia stuartii]ELR5122847.1 DUF937 domain-containing protein [Providencia stuartii]ELR5144110.1 DUF937 domain-containing protein [Providencia stuartii]ELR5293153.1 DUF937 domain-containing protein [Providencia stuartii]